MKKIKCTIDYPWAGIVSDEQVIEVEDNATEEEIEEAVHEALEDMVWDRISGSWSVLDED